MMMNKIYIGADHAGYDLKEKLKVWFKTAKIPSEDCGNTILDKNDDYPDFAERVALKVVKHRSKGILLCGSAEGICIAANKVKGIRAVNPHDSLQTKQAREHNDANVLCLGGGGTLKPIPGLSLAKAKKLITLFLKTPFSQEARHLRRLEKITKMEER